MSDDLQAAARALVDAASYATLGTADADGRPWVSPVWYAPVGLRGLLWVSRPGARHSRNLAARPDVSLVIFDPRARAGVGSALYAAGVAAEVPAAELEPALAIYSARSAARGLPAWTRADVEPPARHRLYRAVASELSVLGEGDERVAIEP
jgi:pyridoxine/pyridoxamine 5'-phosphate oxidase